VSFLLDTNICSAHLKDDRRLFHRFQQHSGQLFVTPLIVAELYAWAYGAGNPVRRCDLILQLLKDVQVLDFDLPTAEEFGRLRVDLSRQGIAVEPFDLLSLHPAPSCTSSLW
jgi:tRNA(fMet)-specific endonuclease VapC